MVHLIDSHCHLTDPALAQQVPAVLERAAAAGVTDCITIAQDLADAEAALALAAEYPPIHVAVGIHPHLAAKAPEGWDATLAELARRDDVRAIGETGLDYHYDFSDRASQMRVFRRQLEIASDAGKPIIIHCREAHQHTLAALADFPKLTGVVFHCYSGTRAQARGLYDRGYCISLTGVVTFKNADELRLVAREAPADRLLIETDAPYLSPEPVRKVRPNEPAHMLHTAECVARQRRLALDELAALTTANTRRFFGLTGE